MPPVCRSRCFDILFYIAFAIFFLSFAKVADATEIDGRRKTFAQRLTANSVYRRLTQEEVAEKM
jgi:hypothetical protein